MTKILRAAYFWVIFWFLTMTLFLAIVFAHFRNLLLKQEEPTKPEHRIAILWGKLIFKVMPIWRLTIHGEENKPAEDEAVVIVANHAGSGDICALFATDMQFRWLSKAEIFKVPAVGLGMRWAGYIPVKRGDKESHLKAFEASAACLRKGISMVFFPEGTRSKTGKLQTFKKGAFRLAAQEDVPILPIAIVGTHKMMAKDSIMPHPADVHLYILPKTRKQKEESMDMFIARVRNKIEKKLEEAQKKPS